VVVAAAEEAPAVVVAAAAADLRMGEEHAHYLPLAERMNAPPLSLQVSMELLPDMPVAVAYSGTFDKRKRTMSKDTQSSAVVVADLQARLETGVGYLPGAEEDVQHAESLAHLAEVGQTTVAVDLALHLYATAVQMCDDSE
jgi:hypothetical protein